MYYGLINSDKAFSSKTEAMENLPYYRNHCNVHVLLCPEELPKPYNKHILCCEKCSEVSKKLIEYGGLKKYNKEYGPKSDKYLTTVQVGDIRTLGFCSFNTAIMKNDGSNFINAPEVCVLNINEEKEIALVAYVFPTIFKVLADKGDILVGDYYVETWNAFIVPLKALTDMNFEWKGYIPQVYLPKEASKKAIKNIIDTAKKKPPIVTNDIIIEFRKKEMDHCSEVQKHCNFYYSKEANFVRESMECQG